MLETKRLLLRDFDPLDAADVLEYTSQKQVAKDAGFMPCETLMQALFFGKMLQSKKHFVIELKEQQKVIGNIGLYEVSPHQAGLVFEVGYVLNQNYWHKGYMTEALRALSQLAQKKDAVGLEARVAKRNQASIKLLERCGFRVVEKYVVNEWFVVKENRSQLLFYKQL